MGRGWKMGRNGTALFKILQQKGSILRVQTLMFQINYDVGCADAARIFLDSLLMIAEHLASGQLPAICCATDFAQS